MQRIIGLGVGCAVAMTALLLSASPVRAQASAQVTITLQLTVNGTVPAHDSFVASWGTNGVELCPTPCAGGGRTYSARVPWAKGAEPIHVVFLQFRSPSAINAFPAQRFGQQTVIPQGDRTVSAVFTYGSTVATIAAPATGAAPPLAMGVGMVAAGALLMLLSSGRRRAALPEG